MHIFCHPPLRPPAPNSSITTPSILHLARAPAPVTMPPPTILAGTKRILPTMTPRNLLICFDAFGTLFKPRAPIEQQYGEVARSLGLAGIRDDDVRDSFKTGRQAMLGCLGNTRLADRRFRSV